MMNNIEMGRDSLIARFLNSCSLLIINQHNQYTKDTISITQITLIPQKREGEKNKKQILRSDEASTKKPIAAVRNRALIFEAIIFRVVLKLKLIV